MHKWAKQIMECVKTKVDSMGIDNIEGSHLEELEKWVCIADKVAEMDYYFNVVEAMKKTDPYNEGYGKEWDEDGRIMHPDRKYYSHNRMNNRRMYDEDGEYAMDVDTYRHTSPYNLRQMDRQGGMRYYTDPYNGVNENSGGRMHYTENSTSEYDNAKRHYTEQKSAGKDGMQGVEKLMNVVSDDIKELLPMMDAHEKTMLRQKMNNLMSSIN